MTKRPHANLELIRQVLGHDYLEHKIHKLVIDEDVDTETSRVSLTLDDGQSDSIQLEGQGCGMINALLHALTERFSAEYESLKTVQFSKFVVQAKFDTKHERSGTDAIGEVFLTATNSEGQSFSFSDASRSLASSAARTVLAAVEYFINAERAYVTLYRALKDAKERDRTDLVTRYTRELAEVVKSTSYAEVIEKIKNEVL